MQNIPTQNQEATITLTLTDAGQILNVFTLAQSKGAFSFDDMPAVLALREKIATALVSANAKATQNQTDSLINE